MDYRPILAILLCMSIAAQLAAAPVAGGHSSDRDRLTIELIRDRVSPLQGQADLDPLIDRVSEARLVLLGEATHGTSEFYTWRAAITRRLIEEKNFAFIVVEGDWTDSYRLNLYVRGLLDEDTTAREIMQSFERWPTWMWANEEVLELVEWLRAHNAMLPPDARIGFYGLDIYGAPESKRQLIRYLEQTDEDAAAMAAQAYSCMSAYARDFTDYARALAAGAASCEAGVARVLEIMRERAPALHADSAKAFFNAKQNAYTVDSAERHFRTATFSGTASWNHRARHFHDTALRLLGHHQARGPGIVWAHNTHVGDARATSMGAQGMLNIGKLARDSLGDEVVIVGFGLGGGELLAGRAWGDQVRAMAAAQPLAGSIEDLFQRADVEQGLLVFTPDLQSSPLADVRPHRAIGVTFEPRMESQHNYVPTSLARRYDAFIYIDHTTPLRQIGR